MIIGKVKVSHAFFMGFGIVRNGSLRQIMVKCRLHKGKGSFFTALEETSAVVCSLQIN